MMKFRQEHKANFKFTDSEIFTIIIINDFQLQDTFFNDILYNTIPQVNITIIHNAIKRRIIEITNLSNDEHFISELSELEFFRKRLRFHSNTFSSELLTYSPANL